MMRNRNILLCLRQIIGKEWVHPRRFRQLLGGREMFVVDRGPIEHQDTDARGTVRDGMRLGPLVYLRR